MAPTAKDLILLTFSSNNIKTTIGIKKNPVICAAVARMVNNAVRISFFLKAKYIAANANNAYRLSVYTHSRYMPLGNKTKYRADLIKVKLSFILVLLLE